MTESYYAGVYWGPRKESPEVCARRLLVMFEGLGRVDSALSRWFMQAKSRAQSLSQPFGATVESLAPVVLAGKDPTADELGFSLSGWSGAEDDHEACGFRLACGGFSEWVGNRCVITLSNRGVSADRLLTASVLTGLVRAMAAAWEPDWGGAFSEQHRELVRARRRKGAPQVGWVTYLAGQRGGVPPLDAPVQVEPVEDKGSLIVLTPSRFSSGEAEHVALAERVSLILEERGLLAPIRMQP